ATALNLPIGSLYAFSVFLKPLEALLGLGRAELAFVFALAAAGFGVGMNLTPYVARLASPPTLVAAGAVSSTAGVALAATAGGLTQLAVGYGVLFGAGGGASYILVQQAVNLAVTRRHGLANGYVVSLLPAGAMLAAPLFGWCVDALGVRAALWALAAAAQAVGLGGNVALTLWPGPRVSVLSLALAGVGYGLISGLTAAAVAVYWRRALYGRIASRLYIAWCAAAIVLPIAAGRLFDVTQSYRTAVLISAGSNAPGFLIAVGLPRQGGSRLADPRIEG